MNEDSSAKAVLSWEPVVPDAQVTISMTTEDAGCLLVAGTLANTITDEGKFEWATYNYRSPLHDCTYILTLERRTQNNIPASWIQPHLILPASDVFAETIHTVTQTWVAKQK